MEMSAGKHGEAEDKRVKKGNPPPKTTKKGSGRGNNGMGMWRNGEPYTVANRFATVCTSWHEPSVHMGHISIHKRRKKEKRIAKAKLTHR